MKKVYLGFYGLGTVGGGTYKLLERERARIAAEYGVELAVKRVLVSDVNKPRAVDIDRALLTADAADVYGDPDISTVLEFMGGEHPAYGYCAAALAEGKTVVTANKVMLAARWQELAPIAEEHGAGLYFEAAAMGGVPIIRTLLTSMQANEITRIAGIVNGTTNFMLSEMAAGCDYAAALAEAQRLGYAEPDPTADVSGGDAAAKAVILGSLAFGRRILPENVAREGIENVSARDVELARKLGCAVKLTAVAERTEDGVSARVQPSLVPFSNPLARVDGVLNGILVSGRAADIFMQGPGAGPEATASALLADVVNAATEQPRLPSMLLRAPAKAAVDRTGAYYIRVCTTEPEAAAAAAGAVRSVYDAGELALVTAPAPDGELKARIAAMPNVAAVLAYLG